MGGTATIKDGQADHRLEFTVATHDTLVIMELIELMTNLYIPEVRKIIKGRCVNLEPFDFRQILLEDIDYHMYGNFNNWEANIPLVLESDPNNYSHIVKLRSSLSKTAEEIHIMLTTHAITDPIVVEWIASFKGSLAQTLAQRAINPSQEQI